MSDQPHAYAALGGDPIRTIDRDELAAKVARGDDFKLIMALNRWAYDAKHIPGSLHFDTPSELYAAVRPDDEVVVYCSTVDCLSSVALYRDLLVRGYRDVRRYAGGLLDWEDAGLPLEGSMASATAPGPSAGTRARTWTRSGTSSRQRKAARTACASVAGGSTCGYVSPAATSAAVTPRRTGTPRRMRGPSATPSSARSSPARTGPGASWTSSSRNRREAGDITRSVRPAGPRRRRARSGSTSGPGSLSCALGEVTARGMTTSALPYRARLFQIDLDLIGHQLLIESGGGTASIDLEAKAVARSIAR